MTWRSGSAFLGLFVVTFVVASVAYAVTYGGHFAQQNTTLIDQLNAITGTYGGEGPDVTSGTVASGWYGHHCEGFCCPEKTQAKPDQSNILKLYVEWEVSDGTDGETGTWTRAVTAKTTLSDKSAGQQSSDYDDPSCTAGPPTFNGTGTIDLSSPKKGTSGNSGSGGGAVSSQFAHAANPTAWAKDHNDGPPYHNQSSGVQTVSDSGGWVVDPSNPETHRFDVSATVKVGFSATAKEIVVASCYQKAKAKLEVTAP